MGRAVKVQKAAAFREQRAYQKPLVFSTVQKRMRGSPEQNPAGKTLFHTTLDDSSVRHLFCELKPATQDALKCFLNPWPTQVPKPVNMTGVLVLSFGGSGPGTRAFGF